MKTTLKDEHVPTTKTKGKDNMTDMKHRILGLALFCAFGFTALNSFADGGQASVKDDVSEKNAVQVAIGSKDHTTLVAAVKAADLVDTLANPGPFTVFAPVNAAFEKLPKGTVEALLKPEKKADLADILQYHVSVGVFKTDMLKDGMSIGQANGDDIKITVKDGKPIVNGVAHILASIKVSNGIVHVIDTVLLPPKH